MIRPRTALTATALIAATAAGGTAVATAGTGSPTAAAGDDGLTHAQASKARAAALKAVPGRAVSIDRDRDGGALEYEVTVLTSKRTAREIHLSASYRVLRNRPTDADGLTYAAAGRAASVALASVRGIVTGIDVEDDGDARYEVEVLPASGAERVVRLSSSFRAVTGGGGDDDENDD